MTDDRTRPQRLGEAYAHLTQDGGVIGVPVDAKFWSEGVAQLPPGRLVSLFDMAEDWTVAEMHPEGDEFVLVLSGRVVVHFQSEDAAWSRTVEAGCFVIVPRGVWHTLDVLEQGRGLFITAGEGTRHRPRPAGA